MLFKQYMKIALIGLICSSTHAETLPSAPTMANLMDGASCSEYAANVSSYLHKSQDIERMFASMWFDEFAKQARNPSYSKDCVDGSCTVTFDQGSRGCYIASAAEGKPLNELLGILQDAYQQAMSGKAFHAPMNFGFAGQSPSCTNENKYAMCDLIAR
tara:strand:+ start:85 stop:558 length:474 start_codon:yes stop_codon:yes gene_type:complete